MTENTEVEKEFIPAATKPALIAVVTFHLPPGVNTDTPVVEFISAATKREMRQKLADPMISKVLGLVRGRHLHFQETRNVNF